MTTVEHWMRSSILAIVIAATCSAADAADVSKSVDYNRDIAPLLADRCFACHGPDASAREADLRLDTAQGAEASLESGVRAIVPHDPGSSELIARIEQSDPNLRMPPAEAGQAFADEEIALLKRWIAEGASYRNHWSFEPLHFQIPEVENKSWPASGMDRFVLARLEAAGLTPAPEADRRTLVRRAYFGLLGLPPTPKQVQSFLNDTRPGAYERLVDQLLDLPHFGERWGRHWLDVARYGDSNGGDENHAYPHAWRYRDYVIRAINDDVPYDRFVAEQLAGDLIGDGDFPERSTEKLIGSGFLAIGMKILAEQDEVKKRADMVDEQLDTIGKAFLGLTIACARCHDHKFDPISNEDYYALAGILHSTEQREQSLETPQFRDAKSEYDRKVSEIHKQLQAAGERWASMLDGAAPIVLEAEAFARGNVIVDTSNYGKQIGVISDPGKQENFAEYDVEIPFAGRFVVELRYAASDSRPGRIVVDGEEVNEQAIQHVTGSWTPDSQTWFRECLVELDEGIHTLRIESEPYMSHIDKLRITRAQNTNGFQALYNTEQSLYASLSELRQQRPETPKMMAVADGHVRNVRVHRRGSHLDLGEEVPRGMLQTVAIHAQPKLPSDKSGRVQLARWLTDADEGAGALAARVIVNRLWQGHFGQGLIDSPNNMGTMGARPTHPQLLDYLAQRLIDEQWSMKRLHRLILLSKTYRMASVHTDPQAQRIDPENRLLWRRKRQRLEAEAIRDALIHVTDRLDTTIGGANLMVTTSNPSAADLRENQRIYEDSLRRTIYLPVVRTNVYDFLTLFDFPNAATSVGRRAKTTVPTQALLMMNNPVVIKQAGQLARRVMADPKLVDDPQRIDRLYELLYARPPGQAEIDSALEFLSLYLATIQRSTADESDDPEAHAAESERSESNRRRAWTALCQTLVMSHEFVYIN